MSPNLKASAFMMLSMMGYTVNDMLVKTIGQSLGTTQIIGLRGAILCLLISLLLWQRGLIPRLSEAWSGRVVLRALMELGATLTFLTALVQLPMASTSAILQALPLAVTLGAALFLKEKVGWRRWVAIAIGFIGVLIIIRPGLDSFEPLSLLVLVSVLFAAARDLVTRGLPPQLPSLMVSGVSALLIGLAGLILTTLDQAWQPVTPSHWGLLLAAAAFLFVGYQFIVLAMRSGEIGHVLPFRYTSLLWAIALGYIVFGDTPDALTLLGSSIVVATGLFTVYREVRLGRRTTGANLAISNLPPDQREWADNRTTTTSKAVTQTGDL